MDALMAAVMYAAGQELHSKRACFLVNGWCSRHDGREFSTSELIDHAGAFKFQVEVARNTNAQIPTTLSTDWIDDGVEK
jgi:vacuolar-type H+-ATPase subunit I/STV1